MISHAPLTRPVLSISLVGAIWNGAGAVARAKAQLSALALGLVVLLATGLRLYDLGKESYWIDEITTVTMVKEGWQQSLVSGNWDRPPIYMAIAQFWIERFGTSEVSTRSLSAIFGIAAIPLVYLLALELFGRRVGLLSALLMAVSEFQIFYSQETRYYSLFELATLLSFLFFHRTIRRGKRLDFILGILSTWLVMGTHAFGLFVLVAQYLYVVLRWTRLAEVRKRWILCQLLALTLILPPFLPLLVQLVSTWRLPEGLRFIQQAQARMSPFQTLYRFVFPARADRPWSTIISIWVGAGAFFALSLLLVTIARGKRRWDIAVKELSLAAGALSRQADQLLLLACWLACALGIPYILGQVVQLKFFERYAISAAPAMCLLLALGISSLRPVVPELISFAAFGIVIAPGLQYYYATPLKQQWREAAAYVQENSQAGDIIVSEVDRGGWQEKSFSWYYHGDLPGCSVMAISRNQVSVAQDVVGCTSGSKRFWLILTHEPGAEQFEAFFSSPSKQGFHLIGQKQFTGITVCLYELAPPS